MRSPWPSGENQRRPLMPKTLAHWEKELERALKAKRAADRNYETYSVWLDAPVRWKKTPVAWRGFSEKQYRAKRLQWYRWRRLARLALREKEKVDRRIAYIEERIRALRSRTAWDRVLGKSVV